MPWFKVDDGLDLHPKVLAAGNAAMGLWVRAGAYSARQLTDGEISPEVAALLGTKAEAKRLVKAGLWVPKDDGYAFHEWELFQPSRVQVMADREASRQRQQRAREAARARREGGMSR